MQKLLPLGAALSLGSLLCLGAQTAVAAVIFDFAYAIPSNPDAPTAVSASGVLTADPTGTLGEYLVTSITGTRNGEAITGLVPPFALGGNDNLVSTTEPHLTGNGLSYRVAGSGDTSNGGVNVYLAVGEPGEPAGANYTEANPSVGYTPTFTLTPVTASIPEPMSLALLGTGLLGLCAIGRHRDRRPASGDPGQAAAKRLRASFQSREPICR